MWTCPMHPQIRQDHPGACPICGMALEPEMVTADTGPSAELIDMTRRFWVALILTLPVFVLEMGGHLFPSLHHLVPMKLSTWIQFALATPRSEEHTSELQSLMRISYAVFCLKKQNHGIT